ncbi:MAG: SNF2-related protein [Candidatus Odinarchaeota archaeon]
MVLKINPINYSCPFCGKELGSRFSKCFNIYCQGQKFNVGNLIIYRLNPDLGIGKIIKKLEIPTSKSLDDEDTFFVNKYKVLFENSIVKVIHPIDLIHYVFKLNDKVVSKQGIGYINTKDFLIKDGILSYEFLTEDGKKSQIFEYEIYSKYETPIKTLISKQSFDPPINFLIKYWANLFYSYYKSYQIKCITNSRLTLMPHQINVTHRLAEEFFPRIILADEVGLGKTIEAGIYIKEMIARDLAERILIIVPASLVKQWAFEMSNKFNLEFTIYDGKKIKELKSKGTYKHLDLLQNPFYYDNLIICSLQFARNRNYIELLSRISWDIVIFDEAHHLRRYLINAMTGNFRETLNYELAKKLSLNSESMLLLTATPLQLHSFELFSLIELIQPEVFENFSDFEHFRKNMPFINLLITNLNNIDKLNNFEVKNTIKLLKDLKYIDKNKSLNQILSEIKDDSFKLRLLKRIEEDHTLSKFLIRNRKKNVFSEELLNKRIVKTIMVNPTSEELEIYNEIRLYLAKIYNSSISKENTGIGFIITTLQKLLTSSKQAFLKSIERRLDQLDRYKDIFIDTDIIKQGDPDFYEAELEDLFLDTEIFDVINSEFIEEKKEDVIDLLNQEKILKEYYNKLSALPYDSKSDQLLELLDHISSQNPQEKIIIFTQFVDTMKFLKSLIESQNSNYDVEIFYGGLDKVQKDEAVERFRSSKKFSLLISTEIGGEGRNFQFCRVLINYDLPWNPMKLEQRIGRLDRIGQKSKEIYIYNIFMEGTVETDIIHAILKRINLFEESIGILEPIIGRIEKDFKNVIFAEEDGKKRKKLNEFYRTLDEEVRKAKEIEMQLDDLMIDKKSFQMEGLITSLASCVDVKLTHNELYLLMRLFFNNSSHLYGILEDTKDSIEIISKDFYFPSKVVLNNNLLDNPKYQFQKEYIGTFNLDLARKKEEIDFFALGHPLINNILDYCINDEFSGNLSILFIRREELKKFYKFTQNIEDELYLFIFSVKFQGYIIENQISAIIIDKNGKKVDGLVEIILDIKNFSNLFLSIEKKEYVDINYNIIRHLQEEAKKIVKWKTSVWKREIRILNNNIFIQEKKKKEKIYAHKRNTLNLKLESLSKLLEQKENKKPTRRQLQNIERITDAEKKKERLVYFEKLEEDIKFINEDIKSTKKKLDDLSFEFEDLKNEMIKRNRSKYYTNLISFALLKIVED